MSIHPPTSAALPCTRPAGVSRARGYRRRRRFGPLLPILLGLLGASCGTPVSPGTVQPVTDGLSPSTLEAPRTPVGGVIELSRVAFAGASLSSELVGDARALPTSGRVWVVGAAALAYPRSAEAQALSAALPRAPGPGPDGSTRCEILQGRVRGMDSLGGVSVDVGATLNLVGGQASLALDRILLDPAAPVESSIHYYRAEAARTSSEGWSSFNWASGSFMAAQLPGADAPRARTRASLPYTVTVEQAIQLPIALEGLTLNGIEVLSPAVEPTSGALLEPAPRFELPAAGAPLELTWKVGLYPQSMVISVEAYGPGPGRCPRDCGDTTACCSDDNHCRSEERCEAFLPDGGRACFPLEGSGLERLSALVCSLPDSGSGQVDGQVLDDFLSQLPAARLSGMILRVGRSTQSELTLPGVLTREGTAQVLSPVLARAGDVIITRLNLPVR